MKDSVSLRIYCNELDWYELEKKIGIKWTKVWKKWDLMRSGNKYNINWYTYTVYLDTIDVDDIIEDILIKFDNIKLIKNCKKILTIWLYSENNRKIYLQACLLWKIYNLWLDLDIDIIYE